MCTNECGRPDPPDEQSLMGAFDTATRAAFGFLEAEHQLRPASLATFQLDGSAARRAIPPDEAAFPFLAVLEFTGANPPVRVSYGGMAYQVEVEVGIGINGSGFHGLESWLEAMGIDSVPSDHSGVAHRQALEHHLERLAESLGVHFPEICRTGPAIVSRLGAGARPTAAHLNRSRDRAHAAFAAGDYETYVSMLGPFESALTVTERRKLDFARARQTVGGRR